MSYIQQPKMVIFLIVFQETQHSRGGQIALEDPKTAEPCIFPVLGVGLFNVQGGLLYPFLSSFSRN